MKFRWYTEWASGENSHGAYEERTAQADCLCDKLAPKIAKLIRRFLSGKISAQALIDRVLDYEDCIVSRAQGKHFNRPTGGYAAGVQVQDGGEWVPLADWANDYEAKYSDIEYE